MKRNKFSLSHTKLLSGNMGELLPIGLTEVLPGDTIQHATSALVRASPLVSPVMHPVDVRIHHWYVPYRLVWEDWEDFITGGPDGMDASVFPTITFGGGSGAAVGSLADYLGVPTGVNALEVSALPFRAYAYIWNEWYRDQDLQTALVIDESSGADTTTSTALQNCAWEKDYFTSARPFEQKGPSITVPIGESAEVKRLSAAANPFRAKVAGSNVNATSGSAIETAASGNVIANPPAGGDESINFDPKPDTGLPSSLFADLTGASAVTINALREAMALQRYAENRARFGSRYVEYLRYLGVRSSDARLQRPEYLGGGRNKIQFSEVLQTSPVDANSPVGNLKGHGIGAMRSNRYRRFFEEHGVVISVMSIRPKTIYVQGLARSWNRRVKEDFWQQELQHIGQQEILNKELYAAHASPNNRFGWQDRYDEYRRQESSVGGEFRTTTLNYWHLARTFSSDPELNATFVNCIPSERIFAASTNHVMYVMANHSIQARRMVAGTGTSFIM